MTTTQTINLGGIAFYIDDDACRTLQSYLQSIEKNLAADADKKDVMRDIEARMAEIFSDMRRREHIEVISIDMVRAVMQQLGKPDDFREEPEEDTPADNNFRPIFQRKIYRDIDHSIIGGVCSGLGHWLGIDAIWMRIIFLLCLLLWGVTLPVYIILWLVMPEAKTAAQRLDMRGEEPTVENIQKEIEAQKAQPAGTGSGCLLTMLKICVWCVGAFFLFIALIVLSAVTIALTSTIAGLVASAPAGIEMLFSGTNWHIVMFVILLVVVIGMPLIGLIYAIVRYARKGVHASPRNIWIAFFVWLLAVAGCIGIGVHELMSNPDLMNTAITIVQ